MQRRDASSSEPEAGSGLALVLGAQGANIAALCARARTALDAAETAGAVLDARDAARLAYDAAKRAARFATAKGAADSTIASAHRLQADALQIEAAAKRRLADEYDAAQERGEVVGRSGGGDTTVPDRNAATASDLGLSRTDIHDARRHRDAEAKAPGVTQAAVDAMLKAGREPTKAALNRAIEAVLDPEAEAERAAIREAVFAGVEAARAGSPRADRRNPLWTGPNPRVDRFNCLIGLIKDLATFTDDEVADLAKLAIEPGYRLSVLPAVESADRAVSVISSFRESVDRHRGAP